MTWNKWESECPECHSGRVYSGTAGDSGSIVRGQNSWT